MSAKSPAAIARPQSPSLGASRWLPMLTHAPMRVLAWVSTGADEGVGVGVGAGATVGVGVGAPPAGGAAEPLLPPPHEVATARHASDTPSFRRRAARPVDPFMATSPLILLALPC